MVPLPGFVISHKDVTKHEDVATCATVLITPLNFYRKFGAVFILMGHTFKEIK